MIDEQELDRQKALEGWDEQSCAEYEAWLDEIHYLDSLPDADQLQEQWCIDHYAGRDPIEVDQEELQDYLYELEREDYEPPCECYYIDVDLVESRFCPAHNSRLRDEG